MALATAGADIQLSRVAASGKFDIQWDTTQNPIFADDQSHAVLSLIYEHKGEYWADASGNRGSYLWTIKDLRKATPSKAQGFIEDALRPLLDTGKIKNLLVSVSRDAFNRNRLNLSVTYSTPGGLSVTLRPGVAY